VVAWLAAMAWAETPEALLAPLAWGDVAEVLAQGSTSCTMARYDDPLIRVRYGPDGTYHRSDLAEGDRAWAFDGAVVWHRGTRDADGEQWAWACREPRARALPEGGLALLQCVDGHVVCGDQGKATWPVVALHGDPTAAGAFQGWPRLHLVWVPGAEAPAEGVTRVRHHPDAQRVPGLVADLEAIGRVVTVVEDVTAYPRVVVEAGPVADVDAWATDCVASAPAPCEATPKLAKKLLAAELSAYPAERQRAMREAALRGAPHADWPRDALTLLSHRRHDVVSAELVLERARDNGSYDMQLRWLEPLREHLDADVRARARMLYDSIAETPSEDP